MASYLTAKKHQMQMDRALGLLYDWTMPGMSSVLYVLVWSIAVFFGGIWVFRRFEGRLAEEL